MFKAKKSEIRRRAKRLLSAFSEETRKQSIESVATSQRKVIRAHYEKGLLVLSEDFVRLPDGYGPSANFQFQIVSNLFTILQNQLYKTRPGKLEDLYFQHSTVQQARD